MVQIFPLSKLILLYILTSPHKTNMSKPFYQYQILPGSHIFSKWTIGVSSSLVLQRYVYLGVHQLLPSELWAHWLCRMWGIWGMCMFLVLRLIFPHRVMSTCRHRSNKKGLLSIYYSSKVKYVVKELIKCVKY